MTNTQTILNYLDSEEVKKHTKEIQREVLGNIEDGTYIVHDICFKIIEKLDMNASSPAWSEEDREEIKKRKTPLQESLTERLAAELKLNDRLGLYEYSYSIQDYRETFVKEFMKSLLKKVV